MMYRLMMILMIMTAAVLHAAENEPTYMPLTEGSSWTYQDTRRTGDKQQQSKNVLEIKKTAEIAGQKAAVRLVNSTPPLGRANPVAGSAANSRALVC